MLKCSILRILELFIIYKLKTVVSRSFTLLRGRSSNNWKVRSNYSFYMCRITSFRWNVQCHHHHVPFSLSGISVWSFLLRIWCDVGILRIPPFVCLKSISCQLSWCGVFLPGRDCIVSHQFRTLSFVSGWTTSPWIPSPRSLGPICKWRELSLLHISGHGEWLHVVAKSVFGVLNRCAVIPM